MQPSTEPCLWLIGQQCEAMDSRAPHSFEFNTVVSLAVMCDGHDEVNQYWDALVAGGRPVQCGWLKDRFGISWQVIPRRLNALLRDPESNRAAAVMQGMLTMVKIDIGALEAIEAI